MSPDVRAEAGAGEKGWGHRERGWGSFVGSHFTLPQSIPDQLQHSLQLISTKSTFVP